MQMDRVLLKISGEALGSSDSTALSPALAESLAAQIKAVRECGVEIGVGRLEARPTATLCIDCKTLDEIKERQVLG